MSGKAAHILNAGEAMKPQPANKLSAATFILTNDSVSMNPFLYFVLLFCGLK